MSEEEINLNNLGNLNPTINPNSVPEVEPKHYPKLPSSNYSEISGKPNKDEEIKKREEIIDIYNSNPKREKDMCFLGDSTKEKIIGKGKYRLLVFLSVLGVLALILGGIGAGLVGYSAYTGKFNSTISNICNPVMNPPVCENTCNPVYNPPAIYVNTSCPANPITLNCGNISG